MPRYNRPWGLFLLDWCISYGSVNNKDDGNNNDDKKEKEKEKCNSVLKLSSDLILWAL